ncbi:MAG: hypothetical protein MUE52_04065 [Tabrizicola sp.]|jgi:Flp pilus assembly protein TadG|nr:hypothetical protein [Tabrizicola sp.]
MALFEEGFATVAAQPGEGMLKTLASIVRGFLSAEEGNATIEFTVLLPVYMGLIVLATDTASIFVRQSNMMDVSLQTARIVSRHALDADAAEVFASNLLRQGSYTPEVLVQVDAEAQTVTVRVTADLAELVPFGVLSRALNDRLSVTVSHALEPI